MHRSILMGMMTILMIWIWMIEFYLCEPSRRQ